MHCLLNKYSYRINQPNMYAPPSSMRHAPTLPDCFGTAALQMRPFLHHCLFAQCAPPGNTFGLELTSNFTNPLPSHNIIGRKSRFYSGSAFPFPFRRVSLKLFLQQADSILLKELQTTHAHTSASNPSGPTQCDSIFLHHSSLL